MLITRFLAAAVKPALVTAAVGGSAAGGFYAWDTWRDDGATVFEQAQSRGQQLVVSEFGDESDLIVAVDPEDVGSRVEIARIRHAPGYGVFASLSPAGDAVAYTALPEDAPQPNPATPAIAGIVEADGDTTILAGDVDLLIPPLWTPDGSGIVVRKNTPADESAGSFELLLLGRDGSRQTLTAWSSAAVFPVGFSPDGSTLYFATLNASGSELYRVGADGSDETQIARLSDEIARDWKLSPDGTKIAYSVAEGGPEPAVRTMLLDIASGTVEPAAESPAEAGEFNPTWSDDNSLTVSSLAATGGGDATIIDSPTGGATAKITDNDDSIDLPLSWSPDGQTLAVRAIDGATPFEAAGSRVELVKRDGSRAAISDSADVLIVGWME